MDESEWNALEEHGEVEQEDISEDEDNVEVNSEFDSELEDELDSEPAAEGPPQPAARRPPQPAAGRLQDTDYMQQLQQVHMCYTHEEVLYIMCFLNGLAH